MENAERIGLVLGLGRIAQRPYATLILHDVLAFLLSCLLQFPKSLAALVVAYNVANSAQKTLFAIPEGFVLVIYRQYLNIWMNRL